MRLVIDFETVDPYLETLGSGWVHGQMQVIGASLRLDSSQSAFFVTDPSTIKQYVRSADVLIAHNAMYDFGILRMWGVDLSNKYLVDTLLMAKLYNTTLISYALEDLAVKCLDQHKAKATLGKVVLEHGLYKNCQQQSRKISSLAQAQTYAISHMDEVYMAEPQIVAAYANQDANLTWDLYHWFQRVGISGTWLEILSSLMKILMKQRQRGVRIDCDRLRGVRNTLYEKEQVYLYRLRGAAGSPIFNPNSSIQVAELLYKYHIPYPLTDKGNPSIRGVWLDAQPHAICTMIKEYRRYSKIRRDFCDSVLEAQESLPAKMKGRVYPEFRIFGASTGRFSCSKPNIQQIPKHDEELAPLIRSVYLANEGQQWYSFDFSQQEYRLFAHYAEKFLGSSMIAQAFRTDLDTDFHTFVATLCHIERDKAKSINFGSLYGMGVQKMAGMLQISESEADALLTRYHGHFVDVKLVLKRCGEILKKDKYITTFGGRRLGLDPPIYIDVLVGYEMRGVKHLDGSTRNQKVPLYQKKLITWEYKGLNKLIQGSAADQIIQALIMFDHAGIPVLFSVHDELNFSLPLNADTHKIKQIMEQSFKLVVPMVVTGGVGPNWAEAKK